MTVQQHLPGYTREPVTHRALRYRTSGSGHGSIVRRMSSSDLGQLIKPFVFLDLFEGEASFIHNMPMHPAGGCASISSRRMGRCRCSSKPGPCSGQKTREAIPQQFQRRDHQQAVAGTVHSALIQTWMQPPTQPDPAGCGEQADEQSRIHTNSSNSVCPTCRFFSTASTLSIVSNP